MSFPDVKLTVLHRKTINKKIIPNKILVGNKHKAISKNYKQNKIIYIILPSLFYPFYNLFPNFPRSREHCDHTLVL